MDSGVAAHGSATSEAGESARIEELIHDLDASAVPNSLMREHLDAAHFYLLGGMLQEYNLTLNLAEQTLPEIADPGLRARLADFIRIRHVKA